MAYSKFVITETTPHLVRDGALSGIDSEFLRDTIRFVSCSTIVFFAIHSAGTQFIRQQSLEFKHSRQRMNQTIRFPLLIVILLNFGNLGIFGSLFAVYFHPFMPIGVRSSETTMRMFVLGERKVNRLSRRNCRLCHRNPIKLYFCQFLSSLHLFVNRRFASLPVVIFSLDSESITLEGSRTTCRPG